MALENPQRYTVTAALIYANGPIHIGHIAGCYLPADIYVRYLRSTGKDVAFISGTDEHGVPITIKAKKEGITPQQVVDKYYVQIKKAFEDFGISFDIYSRTSNQIHHETSQEIFLNIYNNGDFDEEVTEQYYDEVAGQFLADRYIVGTCPVCGNPNAYGDQCERCGTALSPTELIEPHSMLSGSKPILKATKNWFLPLDRMQPTIEEYVNSHTEWKTNVFGQCQSWLKEGLRPRAMTRDLDWGIKVPLPDSEGKVLYVWFDAPIGYISMTKEWAAEQGRDWELYWRDKDTKLVHFIGKDNIVFHCIIFPAMLMAEGSYILADNVPANEFMNLEGDKISTSRNWAVWLHEYLEELPGKQDVLRYVLAANAPETKDSEFTWKDFQARNNSELVGILGNFVNRAVVLTHKMADGRVPVLGSLTEYDQQVLDELALFPDRIGQSIGNYRFREALGHLMDLARLGNKYLAETEPWKAVKTDPQRAHTILNIALQITANLSIVCEPFLPFTAEKIRAQLAITDLFTWVNAGRADLLVEGHALGQAPAGPADLLFAKIEDDEINKQIQKLLNAKRMNELATKEVPQIRSEITYDDFAKMDIRVGTITEAERVPKSDKLLKLKVDDGLGGRQILSGIAKHFAPEEVIGKQVTFLANLAPRKMMGLESQGMILMAEDRDGKLSLITPGETVWNGGTVS
ncbi:MULTISPECIES: methionine--tRNA ligase [unclassified Spirosoma]|uniref:methionine--tRNA ligase n=1 Tax=unclassified Spirosoma TaxID=2621999 RepID=UPI000969A4E8|nr:MULTISPECIES: methionine--tRNA ligase [unclassified Spirosoma]MBN8823741.1 methionine--tRNA ligase [Spirosoma sp.]OJW76713.1 MAG: methionine--tRNA ligase [Spirosoma sp. 48-14]